MKKLIKSIILATLLTSVLAGCGSSTEKTGSSGKDTIILATNAAFVPFEYVDSSGNVVGFDIEISKKIAEKLGKELVIQDVPFESTLVMLKSGKADFVAAGMTVREDRLENADFSDTYFEAKQVAIVLDGETNINTTDDLKDKKIGCQTMTSGEYIAEEYTAAENIMAKEDITQAVMDLQNKKSDVIIIDNEPAMRVVAANNDAGKEKIKVVDLAFEPEYYAIAVNKGNKELLDSINAVLKELKESGEYDKMYKEFFDEFSK